MIHRREFLALEIGGGLSASALPAWDKDETVSLSPLPLLSFPTPHADQAFTKKLGALPG